MLGGTGSLIVEQDVTLRDGRARQASAARRSQPAGFKTTARASSCLKIRSPVLCDKVGAITPNQNPYLNTSSISGGHRCFTGSIKYTTVRSNDVLVLLNGTKTRRALCPVTIFSGPFHLSLSIIVMKQSVLQDFLS